MCLPPRHAISGPMPPLKEEVLPKPASSSCPSPMSLSLHLQLFASEALPQSEILTFNHVCLFTLSLSYLLLECKLPEHRDPCSLHLEQALVLNICMNWHQ